VQRQNQRDRYDLPTKFQLHDQEAEEIREGNLGKDIIELNVRNVAGVSLVGDRHQDLTDEQQQERPPNYVPELLLERLSLGLPNRWKSASS
jgi:hypothetical protein